MNQTSPIRFRLNAPGLYRMPVQAYHSDPCQDPSLSHSIARLILDKSPLHGMTQHPRLGKNRPEDKPTEAKERGSILHSMILGEGSAYRVLDYPDYKTKRAQEDRDALRNADVIPVLAHKAAAYRDIAEGVREQIRHHQACEEFFDEGASEIAMIWQEGSIWCRSLLDRLPERPGAPMFDLKSTGRDASPAAFARVIERDYATQAAFYLRGGRAVLPVPPEDFRFIAFEVDPPYAISVHSLSPEMIDVAEERIFEAVKAFARGLILEEWPGYSTDLHLVTPSPWSVRKMIEAEPDAPTVFQDVGELVGGKMAA